jgi:type 1 glutamine amidotransferase
MKLFYHTLLAIAVLVCPRLTAQTNSRHFNALVLSENGGHHVRFSDRARIWLDQLAADSNFSVTNIRNTDSITIEYLRNYQLFIQLDYPPYNWKPEAASAFTDYIEKGKGGWIGFHHATLLGEFDGFRLWDWFWNFMGRIRFKDYIADFADGTVQVEDSLHPVMKNLPASFRIEKEEWYTYDSSPRPNIRVLASVDESGYHPQSSKKMGDHPVIWSNEKMKAKNIYIFMGHSPDLFQNPCYIQLFKNAIFWAAGRNNSNH